MMKQLRSIRSQMVFFFSILLIIPVVIAMVYVYVLLQSNLKQTYADHQSQTTKALSQELSKWRDTYEELSLQIFGDSLVPQLLRVNDWIPSEKSLGLRNSMRDKLVYYSEHNSYIRGIYLMDNNGWIFGIPDVTPSLTNYMGNMRDKVAQNKGKAVWDSHWNTQMLVLSRRVNDNKEDLNRGIGYLSIIIDRSELLHNFEQFTLDTGQQFRIADERNEFEIVTTMEFDHLLFNNNGKDRIGHDIVTTKYGKYVYYGINQNGWLLSTWISQEQHDRPIYKIRIVVLLILILLFLYLVSMIVYMSNRITKPLRMIYDAMKRIGDGYLDFRVPVLRDDEIGQVALTLNRMSGQIASLIEKNRMEEQKRRMIQLRTMEYQINPHFLYNTLDSVNMLARKYNDHRIGDIVTSLSRLFRIGLNQGAELITVSQEVQHAGYYLNIQGIRFGDHLTWEINLEPDIKELRMIKFLLQPLIENSIMHGIRSRNLPGKVTVNAYWKQPHIVLEVTDNGIGMNVVKLESLRLSLNREMTEKPEEHTQGFGYGLWNVHQRIKLHYGNEYGLDINSEAQVGTTVQIKLPKTIV